MQITKKFIEDNYRKYLKRAYRNFTNAFNIIEEIIDELDDEDWETVINFFSGLKFPLRVFRGLSVKSKDDINLKNPGIHWTVDTNLFKVKNSIIKDSNYILVGEVEENQVDWVSTISTYMYYSLRPSYGFYPENEITLKKGQIPNNLTIVEKEDLNESWWDDSDPWDSVIKEPETVSELLGKDFLYHATYKPYWEEIKRDGYIRPGRHTNWDDRYKTTRAIYLATDYDNAIYYAKNAEDVPKELLNQIVVLKINADKLDVNQLDADSNQIYDSDDDDGRSIEDTYTWKEVQYYKPIPISAIVKVYDKSIIKESINKNMDEMLKESEDPIIEDLLNHFRLTEAYLDPEERFWDYRTGQISGNKLFDITRSESSYGQSFLDNLGKTNSKVRVGKIVEMSPTEYFKACAKGFGSSYDAQINQIKADKDTYQHLSDVIDKYNRQFPITYLDYSNGFAQEGRHRMYVAGERFGWNTKFPVLVIEAAESPLFELKENRESLNEVYPNKGESKKDFINRFMRATSKEYPDVKQRYAVANSYWERRNKNKVQEDVQIDILEKVKNHFGTVDKPYYGPTYILPDGSLLNLKNQDHHSSVEKWLIENGLSKEEYIKTAGSPTIEALGCIRCDMPKYYIGLSHVQPTMQQYNTLLIWLDQISSFVNVVSVMSPGGSKFIDYRFSDDFISDDIVDRIRRFYISGQLYEQFNENFSFKRQHNFKYVRNQLGMPIAYKQSNKQEIV